jgi:hypothetical protein
MLCGLFARFVLVGGRADPHDHSAIRPGWIRSALVTAHEPMAVPIEPAPAAPSKGKVVGLYPSADRRRRGFRDGRHPGGERRSAAADVRRRSCQSLTVNWAPPAGLPLAEITRLYLPAGQPSGFEIWNSVTAGPVGAMFCVASFTT